MAGALSFSPRRSSLKMSATDLIYAELLVEILSWLPVDSLLRFRFVSKSWFKLITNDSTLVKMHLLHHHNRQFDKCCPTFLFSKENYETIYSLNLKTDDKGLIDPSQGSELVHSFKNPKSTAKSVSYLDFLGSCNGLICIKVYCIDEYQNVDKSTLYIWNPTTKEFKQIPDSPGECPMKFAHHPDQYPMNSDYGSRIRTTYGFGYDQNIDEYKVIRCLQSLKCFDQRKALCEYFHEINEGDYYDDLDCELKVYTLGTNSWRRIHQQIPYRITMLKGISKPGLLVGGSLHWVAYKSFRFDRIISFDIVDEKYREVPKPEFLDHCHNEVGLQVLRGCLCVHYRQRSTLNFCVWMMMDYGVKDSWTNLGTINDPHVIEIGWNLTPFWLFKNGKILIGMGYEHFFLWDPKSNETKFLLNRKNPPDFEPSKIFYIGSLVSLKSGTYTNRTQVKPAKEDPEQTMGREDDREQTNNSPRHQKMAMPVYYQALLADYAKQVGN